MLWCEKKRSSNFYLETQMPDQLVRRILIAGKPDLRAWICYIKRVCGKPKTTSPNANVNRWIVPMSNIKARG